MFASRNLLFFMAFTLCSIVGGCSSSAQAEPRYATADPVAQQEFDSARLAYEQGLGEQAEQLFSSFIIAHPEDPLRPAAELHLGRIAVAEGDHDEAELWLERASAANDSAIATRARRELGQSFLSAGQPQRALDTLEPLAGTLDGQEADELYGVLVEAARGTGDAGRHVRYLDARCRYGSRTTCATARERIDEVVSTLDETTLSQLSTTLPQNGHGWTSVTSRLGVLVAQSGDEERAATILARLEQADAGSGSAGDAVREAIDQIERLDWAAVGVLIPLSGRTRLVGEQIQAGLEIAAASSTDPLRLVIRDSAAAGIDGIAAVIDDLVQNEGVTAIVGPVDSAMAQAAARHAQQIGVPILALSIRPQLPEEGHWVLRPFQSNESEVRLLIGHAMQRLGLRTFAVLHPDQGYGRVLRDLVQAEVTRLGGSVVVVRSYPASRTSFVEDCQELAQHEFDALVIPDRSRTVALIAPALATAGIWSTTAGGSAPEDGRAVRLLLPSTAFNPGLLRQTGRYLQGALFANVFWIDDPRSEVAQFVEEYREAHGNAPTPYASQSHDAVQLIRAARVRAGGHTRTQFLGALLELRVAPTVGSFEGFDTQGEPTAPLNLLRLDGTTFLPATP